MKENLIEISVGLIDREGIAPQNEIGSITGSESESHMSTRIFEHPLRTIFAVYVTYILIQSYKYSMLII